MKEAKTAVAEKLPDSLCCHVLTVSQRQLFMGNLFMFWYEKFVVL
jgi:hypothetical protein